MPVTITHYSFGRIVIAGMTYTADLIVHPDGRVQPSWWRQKGHALTKEDIAELIAANPDVIIAGTGAFGMMKPDANLAESLERKNIAFMPKHTKEAVALFNTLSEENTTIGACFHLTC